MIDNTDARPAEPTGATAEATGSTTAQVAGSTTAQVAGVILARVAESTAAQVAAAGEAASAAFAVLRAVPRATRAALLDAAAEALRAGGDRIIAAADRETALGVPRLTGELARTCFQLSMFADLVRSPDHLDIARDAPADTPLGRRPDLRRMLVPIGPVAVFGAGNFPLAFSVPGGDTASALAAGCPVVVKAHPAHPATSELTFAALRAAVAATGLPAETVQLIHGQEAGAALVRHPAIRAVGFTGSLRGGRVLADLAAARPDPIPFYGELGSTNPVVVTPAAATARADEIAAGFAASMMLGQGQFCTKPGLLFIPAGVGGDRLRAGLRAAVGAGVAAPMLSAAIRDAYLRETAARTAHPAVTVLAGTPGGPVLHEVAAADLAGDLLGECFGPAALVVRYTDPDDLLTALTRLDGQLTATLHLEPADDALAHRLHDVLVARAGRLVFNGFPTGVTVAPAMQHGGPWPASTAPAYTSVGTAAVRRWLRPVVYQDAPERLLPEELRGPVGS